MLNIAVERSKLSVQAKLYSSIELFKNEFEEPSLGKLAVMSF